MKALALLNKYAVAVLMLSAPGFLRAQLCNYGPSDVKVYSWKPAYGSIPRFAESIADSCNATGLVVILGRDAGGVYTIEGGMEDDARGGDYANLAYTAVDGKRSVYKLYDGNMLEKFIETPGYNEKKKNLMVNTLWKLAAEKRYLPAELKPVYYQVSRAEHTPTVLEISLSDAAALFTWTLHAKPDMCWCFYSWNCEVSKTN